MPRSSDATGVTVVSSRAVTGVLDSSNSVDGGLSQYAGNSNLVTSGLVSQRCGISDEAVVAIDSDYDEFIDRIARAEDPRTISNSSTTHALSLVRAMFRYAKNEICIFSGSLSRRVYDDDEVVRDAERFVKNGGRIRVLLQQNVSEDSESKLLSRLKLFEKSESDGKELVLVKKTTPSHPFDDAQAHFMVMDGRAYRIETDVVDHKAVACFKDADRAVRLECIFNKAFANQAAVVC